MCQIIERVRWIDSDNRGYSRTKDPNPIWHPFLLAGRLQSLEEIRESDESIEWEEKIFECLNIKNSSSFVRSYFPTDEGIFMSTFVSSFSNALPRIRRWNMLRNSVSSINRESLLSNWPNLIQLMFDRKTFSQIPLVIRSNAATSPQRCTRKILSTVTIATVRETDTQ